MCLDETFFHGIFFLNQLCLKIGRSDHWRLQCECLIVEWLDILLHQVDVTYSYFLWIEFNDGVPHLVLFGNYVWGNIVSLFKLSLIITLIHIATNTMAAHS